MASTAPSPQVERLPPNEADSSASSDFARLRELAGLVLHAPLRHRRLALVVFALVAALSVAATLLMPRVYAVNTKILTQRNLIIPSLGNPRRSVPSESDALTRSAGDVILGRDNLIAIAGETELLARWDAERPPLLRLKDRVLELVRGPLGEEDRRRALIGVLEKKLRVQADDSIIRISIEWPNAETAHRIVAAAEKNFFEGRKAAEIAVIADTIDILRTEADRQRTVVDTAFVRVMDLRRDSLETTQRSRPASSAGAPSAPAQPVTIPAPPPPEQRQVTARLEEKRRAIRAIEEPRQQRIVQLEVELARLRTTLAAAHPAIRQVEADLEAARIEPQALGELRKEEHDLVAQLDFGLAERRWVRVVPEARGGSGASVLVDASPHEDEPELATAKTKLTAATHKYEDLMDRADSARIELHAAQAAFKYRYTVLDPPEIPREAKRPSRALLVAGGLVLGALLAVFAAAARDLSSGRFVEAWQVRRQLAVPVLAELDGP